MGNHNDRSACPDDLAWPAGGVRCVCVLFLCISQRHYILFFFIMFKRWPRPLVHCYYYHNYSTRIYRHSVWISALVSVTSRKGKRRKANIKIYTQTIPKQILHMAWVIVLLLLAVVRRGFVFCFFFRTLLTSATSHLALMDWSARCVRKIITTHLDGGHGGTVTFGRVSRRCWTVCLPSTVRDSFLCILPWGH